jgi:transcriptional regulator with XRE-family HTH domain
MAMQDKPEIKLEEKLTELLTRIDSSGSEIAREIGVSPASISQYRKGETQPSLEKLVALAKALDVSLDYLVLGDDREAEEVDIDPIVRYMDQSLQDAQVQTAEHSALVAQVGRRLSQVLDDEIEKYLAENSNQHQHAGMVTDPETRTLEQHSQVTRLVLQSFYYNLVKESPEIPGSFFTTVANNLSQGNEYQYLLPENAGPDWTTVVPEYRKLLIEQTGSENAVHGNCEFRVTTAPIFAGCGLYQLAVDDLEDDDPVLYDFLYAHEHIDSDNIFGYVTLPSPNSQGVLVMDESHLSTAIAAFDDLWKKAEPI